VIHQPERINTAERQKAGGGKCYLLLAYHDGVVEKEIITFADDTVVDHRDLSFP
jgi:hypothetical protein